MKLQATLGLAAALALSGPAFAGKQEAELALTQARSSVAAAERADAINEVPQDFNTARDALARAQGSFEEREWDDAEFESHRARADARVAEARSRQAKAERALTEIEAAIDTLRAEIARNRGA
jgi:chromosome segregation ATPase